MYLEVGSGVDTLKYGMTPFSSGWLSLQSMGKAFVACSSYWHLHLHWSPRIHWALNPGSDIWRSWEAHRGGIASKTVIIIYFGFMRDGMKWELDEAYGGLQHFVPQQDMGSWLFLLHGEFSFHFCQRGQGQGCRFPLFFPSASLQKAAWSNFASSLPSERGVCGSIRTDPLSILFR